MIFVQIILFGSIAFVTVGLIAACLFANCGTGVTRHPLSANIALALLLAVGFFALWLPFERYLQRKNSRP